MVAIQYDYLVNSLRNMRHCCPTRVSRSIGFLLNGKLHTILEIFYQPFAGKSNNENWLDNAQAFHRQNRIGDHRLSANLIHDLIFYGCVYACAAASCQNNALDLWLLFYKSFHNSSNTTCANFM